MKTLLTALVMGVCGAVAATVSFSAGWPTWVMFIAWVSYYLFGKSIPSAGLTIIQLSAGILMGVAISAVSGILTATIGAMGFPLTVFLIIGSLAFLSKIKGLGNIPVWFLGLIIFFGVHPPLAVFSILQLLIPILAGFVFAIINDYGMRAIHSQKTISNN